MAFLSSNGANKGPQDLFGQGPQIAQYLGQKGLPGILGDLGPLSSLSSAIPFIGPAVSGLTAGIPALISAFSGRPKMDATQSIASGANAYSDPVIQLLGAGASNLASRGVPISSSDNSASSFGPYFDAARRAEDIIRWGAGGASDPKAQALDATTLKSGLTELGNPSKDGTGTLGGIQNVWNSFLEKNPKGSPGYQKLLELTSQMSPAEAAIFQNAFQGGGGGPSSSPTGLTTASSPSAAALAPLLIGGEANQPMQPIRLPDVQDQSKDPQKQQNKQKQLMALLSLLMQNGQS